ncbi:hypothetical protein BGI41_04340 [Methanobrevibacter sp. 87.7]|uniref:4,5-DOPA-extradiol-dioxygenase n=1 Tax=Methanobrevibacter sp. 87.7 TaxID=387957 RepID=UPI000B502374|nr:4,5-DOPA dioxygenase extradiol [Methanobrevibacter sp. 87.7]OWT33072.1 hypothetical protein BGI41_04340 [Methanobrevibacter sp. 87.7]
MTKKEPVIFVGHGSSLNAIGDNPYRTEWKKIGKYLGKPKVIIAFSAHWFKEDLYVRTADFNKQINDMYGFPDELYQVHYEPKGSPDYAKRVLDLLGDSAEENNDWGIDHGVWSVLSNMYPDADIPVVMISVNVNLSSEKQFEIGKKLRSLREEGALILASGNIVHNLTMVDWRLDDTYDWAKKFNNEIKDAILNGDYDKVVNYENIENYNLAIPTTEHFIPLLNVLGLISSSDKLIIFNDKGELGSISMTSFLFEDSS